MKLYPNIVYIFTAWLVSVLLVSFIGFSTLPHSNKFEGDFFISFANWDGGHYLGIAQLGYREDFQYAFFPLYPLLVRLLNSLFGSYLIAGLAVSIVSTFLGLQLLYQLVSLDFDKKIAEKVVYSLLFFPASFYFLTTYSEGLFLLLIVATFFFLRKGNLFAATVFAAAASATRLVGLAVVVALLIEVFTTTGINRKNWYVLLAPAGFLIYCIFLFNQTKDPFYFIAAEQHWQRSLVVPGFSIWDTVKSLVSPGFVYQYPMALLDLIFAAFGIGLSLRAIRFLPPAYVIYGLFSISLPILTPSLSSIPRFLLVIFPIYILIALWKNKYAYFAYQLFSLLLLSALAIAFINGYWVS